MGDVLLAQMELYITPFEANLLRRALIVASDDGAFTDAESEYVAALEQRLTPKRVRL